MTDDPALSALLRRFAALSREERDLVLGQFGQSEREALRLALSESAGTALSHGLAALVDRCREGKAPPELTRRAAAALLAAVDAATGAETIELVLQARHRKPRPWARLLGREAAAA